MFNVFNPYINNGFPEDWDNEEKYPNKKLEKEFPARSFEFDGKIHYTGLLHRVYSYDSDAWPSGRGCASVSFCPECNSTNITAEEYNDLHPEVLAGSAGLNIKCNDCGFTCMEIQIMS